MGGGGVRRPEGGVPFAAAAHCLHSAGDNNKMSLDVMIIATNPCTHTKRTKFNVMTRCGLKSGGLAVTTQIKQMA